MSKKSKKFTSAQRWLLTKLAKDGHFKFKKKKKESGKDASARFWGDGVIENSKYGDRQNFYCTVCKMKTYTFHSHNGRNISKTKRKVKTSSDITNILN